MIRNKDNSITKLPYTNRGAVNTQTDIIKCANIPKTSLNIDFFSFTVNEHLLSEFCDYFGVNFETINVLDFGLNGYRKHIIIREKIKIFYDHPHNQGLFILLSGHGCRIINKYYDWLEFFHFIKKYEYINDDGELIRNYNITRIDIAKDFYNLNYDLIKRINKYIKSGSCCSRFKTSIKYTMRDLKDGSKKGDSIRFGKKVSRISIIFYNKKLERIVNDYEIHPDVESWYRMEVNYRHENAMKVFDLLVNDIDSIDDYNSKIINNYLSFKKYSNQKDSNISRRAVADWWFDIINTKDKLNISTVNINSCLMQKSDWLDLRVSKALLTVLYGKGERALYNLLCKGFDKLKYHDLDIINEFIKEHRPNTLEIGYNYDDIEKYLDIVKRCNL